MVVRGLLTRSYLDEIIYCVKKILYPNNLFVV